VRNPLAKLGIDWSNAATFVMLWLVFSFIVVGFIQPRHGGWKNRLNWYMNTSEPVPDWFPIPLFHADPEKRQFELEPRDLTVHYAFGVTTYAEYSNGKPTLRARVRSGEVMSVDRSQVVVMPFDLPDGEIVYFDFLGLENEPEDVKGRFPVRADGTIESLAPGSTPRPNVWMFVQAWNNDTTWSEAWIVVASQGKVEPSGATIHLPGVSRAAAIGMTIAAALGAVIALFWTWILQRASRWMERRNA
jgi:hypothetical protein